MKMVGIGRALETCEGLKEHQWATERVDDQELIKKLMNHTWSSFESVILYVVNLHGCLLFWDALRNSGIVVGKKKKEILNQLGLC